MHDTLALLVPTSFPQISRKSLEILQINIGLRCNLACLHCHTNSNPYRKEAMDSDTIDLVVGYLQKQQVIVLDITGGAPELHPQFKHLVSLARELDVRVMDRCNLTVLEEPGFEDMHEFLAAKQVEVVASLPCYSAENVDAQRGDGVFETSIRALQKLNSIGYGQEKSDLTLDLVYNPQGPELPPAQEPLEQRYKRELFDQFGIVFNKLFTICNMPIKRFGSTLVSRGQFESYMNLLRNSYQDSNLEHVMCRNLLSVDWQGYVYDCDFNQMLGLAFSGDQNKTHLRDLLDDDIRGRPINVRQHCYGCTAGQGSSCGGALS